MYGVHYNEAWKIESELIISDFFYFGFIFDLHREFLYGYTICILAGMMSIPMGMVSIPTGAMYIPAGMICLYMGMISNQIHKGDANYMIFFYQQE